MTKRIVDESLLRQVLDALEPKSRVSVRNAVREHVAEVLSGHSNPEPQYFTRDINGEYHPALRSALDGDAVEPVTMRLEVDTKNVVATIDKIRNDLIGEGLEEPLAADCCPYCEALIHHAPQPAQKVEPTATTPYNPTEQMRWAAKHIDPALTHEQIRALWCAMWSTAPQPAQKVEPLTDEQIEHEWQFLHDEEGNPPDHHDFARAIEARLASGAAPQPAQKEQS